MRKLLPIVNTAMPNGQDRSKGVSTFSHKHVGFLTFQLVMKLHKGLVEIVHVIVHDEL